MNRETFAKIHQLNGFACRYCDGYAAIVPLDGEWLLGRGDDLDELIQTITDSDGRFIDAGRLSVSPYLTADDAWTALDELTEGQHRVLADALPLR